jgi:hypothetical protein
MLLRYVLLLGWNLPFPALPAPGVAAEDSRPHPGGASAARPRA